MNLRHFAERVFAGDTLEDKLTAPPNGWSDLRDTTPGAATPWREPGRPEQLRIAPKKKRRKMPSPRALHDPALRLRCLHTFANHELMALELMAWAVLAYPEAPGTFRRGLAWLMVEEQRHLRLYMERIEALGGTFGEEPVHDHFWRLAPELTDPLKWVCAMNLTFEQANLDHAPVFAEHFRAVGDEGSAELMDLILEDEIKHVAFGARWLRTLSADTDEDAFQVFLANLTARNDAFRARGESFNEEARRRAKLGDAFIEGMRLVAR
ncbi:MAG: DUF455 family protein [Myxococcota bacterium]